VPPGELEVDEPAAETPEEPAEDSAHE